jgi:hypothetical protein
MTAEIALVSLNPPRPYSTRSHMHTGPLVIVIATPNLWLTRPRDLCIYVYLTVEIPLVSPHPPRPYATRSHMYIGPLVIAIATLRGTYGRSGVIKHIWTYGN